MRDEKHRTGRRPIRRASTALALTDSLLLAMAGLQLTPGGTSQRVAGATTAPLFDVMVCRRTGNGIII